MQQRPTRFYITQEEDHTVVRSVPMARRVRDLRPAEEHAQIIEPTPSPPAPEVRRSVAHRLKAAVKRS